MAEYKYEWQQRKFWCFITFSCEHSSSFTNVLSAQPTKVLFQTKMVFSVDIFNLKKENIILFKKFFWIILKHFIACNKKNTKQKFVNKNVQIYVLSWDMKRDIFVHQDSTRRGWVVKIFVFGIASANCLYFFWLNAYELVFLEATTITNLISEKLFLDIWFRFQEITNATGAINCLL